MLQALLAATILQTALGEGIDVPTGLNETASPCLQLQAAAGASAKYGAHVAHLLHDFSLEDLRRFKPDVGVDNGVPTLALNLSIPAENALLPSVPERASPERRRMLTEGMKTLDDVLSHLGETDWGMPGFGGVEKVAHAFHMLEMRTAALAHYRRLQATPPPAPACACLGAPEPSGVAPALRSLAAYFRRLAAEAGHPSKAFGYDELIYAQKYQQHYRK